MIAQSHELLDQLLAESKLVRGVAVLGHVASLGRDLELLLLSKQKLDKFRQDYESLADGLRALGRAARSAFTKLRSEEPATVKFPFTLEGVVHFASVTCSDMPLLDQRSVERLREDLGPRFEEMFVRRERRRLKAGGEDIVMGLLASFGLSDEQLRKAEEKIFEVSVSYYAASRFDELLESLPSELQEAVTSSVKFQQPAIRFS